MDPNNNQRIPPLHFSFEHKVTVARERVFEFFANPKRLELLHADWSRIRVLHHEPQLRVGAETWVEVMVAGFIPMVLEFRHTLFEPPIRFSEEAIHGPFSWFTHVHEFLTTDRWTIVRDLLEIRLPLQYGGETVLRHIVAPRIRRMFHHRAQALSRLAKKGIIAGRVSNLLQNEI